jgi:predicted HD superfamily hydrolase involved in NAD metabolism
MAITNLYELIHSYIRNHLSKKRVKHSIGVAGLAGSLCMRYDIDKEKGLIAGIGHDIAREFDPEAMAHYALKDGGSILLWEKERPILLHGRAGAGFIREKWGIEDEEILSAIRDHTCGRPGLKLLSKIIMVSDLLEPGRKFLPEEKRKSILSCGIDEILCFVLESKFEDLRRKGREILPPSFLMYEEIKAKQTIIGHTADIGKECGKK